MFGVAGRVKIKKVKINTQNDKMLETYGYMVLDL